MDIFKLVGSVFVNTDEANKSLSKTDEKASGVGNTLVKSAEKAGKFALGLGAAAGAGATALFGVAKSAAETTDNIDKMSQRLGVSREAYQELDFALSQSGVDINSFQTGMKSLLKNMDAVSEGNATATSNFEKLGVSVQNADGSLRSEEDVLFDTISAFQNMADSSEKSRLAQELFGKQGQEIIPLLNSQSGSMEEMRKQAHELGLVMSDEAVDAGVALTDSMDQAKRSFDSIIAKIGVDLMPIIQSVLEWVLEHMPEIQSVCQTVFGVIEVLVMSVGNVIQALTSAIQKYMPQIQQAVSVAFTAIQGFWNQHLKPCFDAISAFVQNVLAPVFKFAFQNVIMPVVQACFKYIGDLWNGTLKPIFTNIIDFITNVFTGNWRAAFQNLVNIVASIFNGIISAVKVPLNIVIGVINRFIGGLNKLKIPNWVPAVGGKGINISTIPLLANGVGLAEKGKQYMLEGSGDEAVIPLSKDRGAVQKIGEVISQNISTVGNDEVIKAINELRDAILGTNIVLDTGVLVGGTVEMYDNALGVIAKRKKRG